MAKFSKHFFIYGVEILGNEASGWRNGQRAIFLDCMRSRHATLSNCCCFCCFCSGALLWVWCFGERGSKGRIFLCVSCCFRWVSFVRGGYAACHWLALRQQLELVDHSASACLLCGGDAQQHNFEQQLLQAQLWLRPDSRCTSLSRDWRSTALYGDASSEATLTPLRHIMPFGSSPSLDVAYLQQQQRQQQRSSSTGRHSSAQGLNLGGIWGAWRRLSSTRSPRSLAWKASKQSATAAAAAATEAPDAEDGAGHVLGALPHAALTEGSPPAEGAPLSSLCTKCILVGSNMDSCSSSSIGSSSAAHPDLREKRSSSVFSSQRPSASEAAVCLLCGAPLGGEGPPTASGAGAPAGSNLSPVAARRWSYMTMHRLVLLRAPRCVVQNVLKALDAKCFPCCIAAVLQPPLQMLLLQQQLFLQQQTGVLRRESSVYEKGGFVPQAVHEAHGGDAAETQCTNTDRDPSGIASPFSLPVSLFSIASRGATGGGSIEGDVASSLSSLRSQSAGPSADSQNSNAFEQLRQLQQQLQQLRQLSTLRQQGSLQLISSSSRKTSRSASEAMFPAVFGAGYEHLKAWCFNAPNSGQCEIVVTPTRLVLLGRSHQQQRQQEKEDAGTCELHWDSEGAACGCPGCRLLLRSLQSFSCLPGLGDFLGVPAAVVAAATEQQQHQGKKLELSQESFVEFYASMELAETHKITSKKSDAKLLCFYFNASKVGVV